MGNCPLPCFFPIKFRGFSGRAAPSSPSMPSCQTLRSMSRWIRTSASHQPVKRERQVFQHTMRKYEEYVMNMCDPHLHQTNQTNQATTYSHYSHNHRYSPHVPSAFPGHPHGREKHTGHGERWSDSPNPWPLPPHESHKSCHGDGPDVMWPCLLACKPHEPWQLKKGSF